MLLVINGLRSDCYTIYSGLSHVQPQPIDVIVKSQCAVSRHFCLTKREFNLTKEAAHWNSVSQITEPISQFGGADQASEVLEGVIGCGTKNKKPALAH